MNISTKRRYICVLTLLLFYGDRMASLLSDTAASTLVDQIQAEESNVVPGPEDLFKGYAAVAEREAASASQAEESALVRSTYEPVSSSVMDWVVKQYPPDGGVVPRVPRPARGVDPGIARSALGISLAPGQSALDALGIPARYEPLAASQSRKERTVRPLYSGEDEFSDVISSIGHSNDPLSLAPFSGELPGLGRRRSMGRPKPMPHKGVPEPERMARVRAYDDIVLAAARKHNVDPNLVRAVMRAESSGDPAAFSGEASGLMQLAPGTAEDLGVTDVWDPEQNIHGGAKYLSQMLERYDGDLDKTIAAYNAGPGAVDKHGGIPPFEETRTYVPRVKNYYDAFRRNR